MGDPPADRTSTEPPPPRGQWSHTDTLWAVVLLALVLAGWCLAATLVWAFVLPVVGAGMLWGNSASESEQQGADIAFLAALVLMVAPPAIAAWMAWRRRWKRAAYGLGALAVALAVLFCCWLGLGAQ